MGALLILLVALLTIVSRTATSDFSLKGDPCSRSDLCGSKTAPQSCSCDADCALYGTCCQDIAKDVEPEFRCYDHKMARPVFAKRACSGDFRGHEAHPLACFDEDEDERDVANNLLVTSRRTKVVYWNRHCARCSNEVDSDLESWNINVLCPRRPGIDASLIRRNLTFDPHQKKWGVEIGGLFHICLLEYSPPGYADQVKPCTPHLVSSCPDNYTDADAAAKCSQYYAERRAKNSNVVYKNIHCAICGAASVQDLECPGISEEEDPDDHDFGSDRVEVTFYGGDWLEQDPGKEFECSGGFAYDPARRKCRRYEMKEKPVVTSRSRSVASSAAVIVALSALLLAL